MKGVFVMHTPCWGDLGNGYYRNPVLNADYSDPDVVRVGKDFYMICSEFHYMGMPVLHSRDLVNWSIIGKVYDRLEMAPHYSDMTGYAKGSWAPSITYHDGWFYVYFCTPTEGLFMTRTQNPAGPWEPLHCVYATAGWEDPCPFWDADGQAYLGHSVLGAGPIIIHRLSADGRRLLDDGKVVYVGKIAEGTKIYHSHGYYLLVIPEGGVAKGWQTVLRSKNIYGPYESKVVLQTGKTDINGPHQGSLIETESGESWFLHFQDVGTLGRVVHLQPVEWVDNWPMMGVDGEPVEIWRKPNTGFSQEPSLPQTSDDFSGETLSLQWAFNHNPVDSHWSLKERPGALRLHSLPAEDLFSAPNTLTQKLMGTSGQITLLLDLSGMASGQRAGLALLGGRKENYIQVVNRQGRCYLEAVTDAVVSHGPEVAGQILLRCDVALAANTRFSFSMDGVRYLPLGSNCALANGFWKGVRPALFSYHTHGEGGVADFLQFTYDVLE